MRPTSSSFIRAISDSDCPSGNCFTGDGTCGDGTGSCQ
jgi:hypothetical protein